MRSNCWSRAPLELQAFPEVGGKHVVGAVSSRPFVTPGLEESYLSPVPEISCPVQATSMSVFWSEPPGCSLDPQSLPLDPPSATHISYTLAVAIFKPQLPDCPAVFL